MANYITLDKYPGYRFDVWQDPCAYDPVSESGCPVEVFAYRGGYGSTADVTTGRLSDMFTRLEGFHDATKALKILRRYLVVFEEWGEDVTEKNVILFQHKGHSPSDWLDLFVAVDDPSPAYGYAESWAEEWSQWARGDVFCVKAERFVPCESPDYCHSDEDSHYERVSDQGAPLSIIGGLYADDEEEAAKYYAESEID